MTKTKNLLSDLGRLFAKSIQDDFFFHSGFSVLHTFDVNSELSL